MSQYAAYEALLLGSAGVLALGLLFLAYRTSCWAAERRYGWICLGANLVVFAAATMIGMLFWLADGYYMVHKQAASYGHQWTPEPPPADND